MALAVFVLRLIVGGVLLAAGAFKVHDGPNAFAAAIAAYRLLPPVAIAPLAIALPYVELALGGYLVLGLFTRVAAIAATVQLAIFSGAIASLVVRGIAADCGCFGSGRPEPATWGRVGIDVLFTLATLVVALRPPGRFAVDTVLNDGAVASEREA